MDRLWHKAIRKGFTIIPPVLVGGKAKRQAFTIIEVVVAAALTLIVAGVIASIFIGTWRAQTSQQTYTQLQLKSRTAADEIAAQIKTAAQILTNASLSGTTYTTGVNLIVLRTPSLDANENILPGTDYFVFRRNPNNSSEIERLVFADAASARTSIPSPTVLNDAASALVFTYYNTAGGTLTPGVSDITTTESVNVSVTSAKTLQGRSYSRQIDAKAFLRNN